MLRQQNQSLLVPPLRKFASGPRLCIAILNMSGKAFKTALMAMAGKPSRHGALFTLYDFVIVMSITLVIGETWLGPTYTCGI